uniref:Protein kinase domain-containing protein n=1 Tax=Cannabis sativa TaxID=3483 RepID=A0A803NRM6_CANSA
MDSSKFTDSQSISLALVTRVEESFRDDNNKFVRADTINLRTFGVELEKMNYNVSWSKELKFHKKEEWGIELLKLKLIREIAKGTYGIVYKGVYDGQDVAGASMGISKLEVPSTNSLNGCQVSYISNACCVLAEYLPGGTLKNYLFKNRRTKLAFKIVIQLALDMARGLSYLHSKSIIHRDLKAENMLLDTHRILKIADFGVARVEAQNLNDMTGETGTLGYMAPEVIGGKPYNRKCDVYSFGICLWEIYCCDMAYPNMNFAEMSSAIVLQNQRPKIPRCCPKSYARIMKKCWDANPEKRPNMADVVKLLEAIDTSKGGGMIPEDQAPGCFYFGTPRGP